MQTTKIYWIDTPRKIKIGIMPRPCGSDCLNDEISTFRKEGVDAIVSLLTHFEIIELNLGDESSICNINGIEYLSLPIEDRSVPESLSEVKKLINTLHKIIDMGGRIAIHCRQGIGRSSLIAAAILTTYGLTTDEAYSRIENSRGWPVPDTFEQIEWVKFFEEHWKLMGKKYSIK